MRNLAFIVLLFAIAKLSAQLDFKKVAPPNPEIGALAKYVVSPVNTYTGLPSTSIPISQIGIADFSLAVNLSYHHGGIMVTEEASNVGLGWVLNAGGMITRAINGKDDFKYYLNRTPPDFNGEVNPRGGAIASDDACQFTVNGKKKEFIIPIRDNAYSGEDFNPDIFYYNFAGYSGSFILKQDRTVHQKTKDGLKILITENSAKIVTPDGITFDFDQVSKQTVIPRVGIANATSISTTGWLLTSVTNTNGEQILLTYDHKTSEFIEPIPGFLQQYMYPYFYGGGSQRIYGPGPYGFRNDAGPRVEHDNILITEIQSPSSCIKITYSDKGEREDITNSYFIKSIKTYGFVIDPNDSSEETKQLISTHNLSYDYFGSKGVSKSGPLNVFSGNYTGIIGANRTPRSEIGYRLKLRSVTKNNEETYSFEYEEPVDNKPIKTSLSQDYWGFYNGVKNDKGSFIPDVPAGIIEERAERYADALYAKVFSLKKITYPTLGYKEFDYELHSFNTITDFGYAVYDENSDSQIYFTFQGNSPSSNVGDNDQICRGNCAANSGTSSFGGNRADSVIQFEVAIPNSPNDSGLKIELDMNTKIKIFWPYNPADPRIPGRLDMSAWITDENDNLVDSRVYLPSINVPQGQTYFTYEIDTRYQLAPGLYKLHASFGAQASELVDGIVQARIKWSNQFTPTPESKKQISYGGGLRIKSISEFDQSGEPQLKKNYKYHYTDTDGVEKSYGKLFSVPRFVVDTYTATSFASILPSGSDEGKEYYPNTIASSNSQNILSKDQGSYVTYSKVIVEDVVSQDSKINGYTEFNFHNSTTYESLATNIETLAHRRYQDFFYKFPDFMYPHNGLPISEKVVKYIGQEEVLLQETQFKHTINGIPLEGYDYNSILEASDIYLGWNKEMLPAGAPSNGTGLLWTCQAELFKFRYNPFYSNTIQLSERIETVYDLEGNNPVTNTSKFFYDNPSHLQRTRTEMTDSNGNTIVSKVYFPDDIVGNDSLGEVLTASEWTAIQRLQKDGEECRIGQPIQTETTENGAKTVQRTNFKTWEQGFTLPEFVQTAKGADVLEDRLTYLRYSTNGKPLEIAKADGTPIIYVWGYNKQYPIAKIINASYTVITTTAQQAINAAIVASDADISDTTENTLRDKLDDLRDDPYFANAQMTTYTYDPLVGVTSVTDPSGYTMSYEYDDLQRLQFVRDDQGKILSENRYQYKNN